MGQIRKQVFVHLLFISKDNGLSIPEIENES